MWKLHYFFLCLDSISVNFDFVFTVVTGPGFYRFSGLMASRVFSTRMLVYPCIPPACSNSFCGLLVPKIKLFQFSTICIRPEIPHAIDVRQDFLPVFFSPELPAKCQCHRLPVPMSTTEGVLQLPLVSFFWKRMCEGPVSGLISGGNCWPA